MHRRLQRDVVYLGCLIVIEPSHMRPNAGGGGSCGVSANEYSCTQEPLNTFRDLTPYLTYSLCTFYYSMLHYVGKVTTLDIWQTPHKMRTRKASTPRTPTTSSIPTGIFLTRTAHGKISFVLFCLFI
jgi:hypothetical protein